MSKSLRIAVVGAGMGGLAVAAALLRRGVDVHVYEQATQFARVGAGIQVSANPFRVLRGIGLDGLVARRAFRPQKYESRDWDTGDRTNVVVLGAEFEARYGAPHLLMHRGDLHSALAGAVPAERIHLGKKFVGVDQSRGQVKVSFEDGTQAYADAVIACDGVHSPIRDLLLGVEDAHFSGYISLRAVYSTSLLPSDLRDRLKVNHFTKWWGPDKHVVTYFVTSAEDEIYFAASYQSDTWEAESWSALGDLDQMRDLFAGFHPDIKMAIDRCPKVYKLAIFEREPLKRWTEGRITLLGDAAHPMTPYMAQGAAMALEDAAVLTRCLTELDASVEDALKAYEATRVERTSKAQRVSHGNTWLRHKEDTAWVFEYDAWRAPLAHGNAAVSA